MYGEGHEASGKRKTSFAFWFFFELKPWAMNQKFATLTSGH